MNKELEALERIRNVEVEIGNNHDTAVKVFNLTNEYDDCFKIIETALKEKEQYEAIEEEFGIHNNCDLIDNLRNIKLLEEVNAKNKKELKVLEIIKEKKVDTAVLRSTDSAEEYNMWVRYEQELSHEQYRALKEVLC